VLCLSAELLQTHADNFTEYALTLGKQSQGLNTFRNNVLALVDKSKLIQTNASNKTASDGVQLAKALVTQGQIHERVQQLA
jgi:hypothetical protein